MAQLDRCVDYWDGSQSVRRFIEARQASTHALVLFEHVPHVLMDWLPDHQEAIGWVIEQGLAIADFLRGEHVAHFDTNPSNIVTDGDRIYFANFVLFLDSRYDLGDAERQFLDEHRYFDVGEFIASLEWPAPGKTVDPDPENRGAIEPFRPIINEMTARVRPPRRRPQDERRVRRRTHRRSPGCPSLMGPARINGRRAGVPR